MVKLKERVINFIKCEGALNDFVIIDGRFNALEEVEKVGRYILDRRASVGGDSLLYLEESKNATIKMRVLEKDGSESAMCGNGARCVGVYFDRFFNMKNITIETLSGIKSVKKIGENYFEVSMGPMQTLEPFVKGCFEEKVVQMKLFGLDFYIVNSSEPHAVTFVKNIKRCPKRVGIKVARLFEVFPKGINVDFVEKAGKNEIKIRTVERGIYDETYACGTGAVASAFVFHEFLSQSTDIIVHALGGTLTVKLSDAQNYLSGPAHFVFEGKMEI
uniref:Diaminopimelate epimerase n=1 Tax=Caldisericum exile TaxID=693075 RepID=A0A7C4Y5N1_9BACT